MKKYWHLFLFLLIFIYTVKADILLGDVDGNGKINSMDYILVRKYILNISTLSNEQQKRADISGDGTVNSMDYILIKKAILDSSKIKENTTFTATFIVQDVNAIKSSSTNISCTANNNSTCEITVPTLTANNGYVVIGWNTEKNAKMSSINGGEKILLSKDITYYSISRNDKPLIGTFIVQNKMANQSEGTTSCYLYNGSSTCEILAPTLTANKANTTIIGWNTNKNATSSSVKSGGRAIIDSDTKYYSITSTSVNITYHVGEDIPGVNTKATSLSFYNNAYTKCTSYNGNGCNIKWIPTIISPGHVVHGFSKTTSGDVINVAKTKFTEDTTLYARVYDSVDGSYKLQSFTPYHYEIVGNVLVQIEVGVNSEAANQFINFIKNIYHDFPNLLMWNGTISFLTNKTHISMFGVESNLTIHGSPTSKDFSDIFIFYTPPGIYEDDNYYLASCIHEITHAYNYGLYWNGGLNSAISKTDDIVNLYNKYKNAANRPSSNYAYNNSSEFYSELIREYYRQHRQVQYNDYPYKSTSNGWSADLTAVAEKYNAIGMNYYRSIGRL